MAAEEGGPGAADDGAPAPGAGPLWVFGYGSLIWNPGFTAAEAHVASLDDFRRSFCMWSIHHRGTPERPGLVLALDAAPGHICRGIAYRVREGEEPAVLAALRERELVSSAYREEWHSLRLAGGARVTAVTYVVERDHEQYTGELPVERQAQVIAAAEGGRGRNDDYLFRTVAQLEELSLGEPELEHLARRVRDLVQRGGTGAVSGGS